jgi:tetratricopeptide (TPR) repeat protein
MDRYVKEELFSSLKKNIDLNNIVRSISYADSYNVEILLVSSSDLLDIVLEYVRESLLIEETPKEIANVKFNKNIDTFFLEIEKFYMQKNDKRLLVLDFSLLSTIENYLERQKIILQLNGARNQIIENINSSVLIVIPKKLKKEFATNAPDFWSLKKYIAEVNFVNNNNNIIEKNLEDSEKEEQSEYIEELLKRKESLEKDCSDIGQRLYMILLSEIGEYYKNYKKMQDVLVYFSKSLKIARSISSTRPDSIEAKRDLSVSLDNVANIYLQKGDVESALEQLEEAKNGLKELTEYKYGDIKKLYDYIKEKINSIKEKQ